MMVLLEDISLEILLLIKFSEPDTIGPHFSNMHTPMSRSVTFVKGVAEEILKKLDH